MHPHKLIRMKKELRRIESERTVERLNLAALEREVNEAYNAALDKEDKLKLMEMKQRIHESALAGEENDTQIWNIRKSLRRMDQRIEKIK